MILDELTQTGTSFEDVGGILLPRLDRIISPGKMGVGISESLGMELQRLSLLTRVYLKRGYLDGIATIRRPEMDLTRIHHSDGLPYLLDNLNAAEIEEFYSHGLLLEQEEGFPLYFDQWQYNSVNFVAVTNTGEELSVVGSARLIYDHTGTGNLPTLIDPSISFFPEWEPIARSARVEFSQLAVDAPSRLQTGLAATTLLRRAKEYSDLMGTPLWIATIDTHVKNLLNGKYYGFGLPEIGPEVDYLGSLSVPTWIDTDLAIENASRDESSKNTADFLRNIESPMSSWYVGL